ncbi:MAG TPA: protein kinase [Gemmataceae bacterium]|nr:protein kinase [Gemmataceae bacterium]
MSWITDFGLAKTTDQALTQPRDIVRTIRYMSPERFRGECDFGADIYALGLTLYELLVLKLAFDSTDRLRLIDQIRYQEPTRLRGVDSRIPRDLEKIVMKAIAKEPKRRHPSAEALAADLRRFLADEPFQARRIGPLERLGRWGRRNPLVASLSAAVVLVAALGFAGVFGQMQRAQANELEAKQHAAKVEQKEQEANQQRAEAQRQRDEVRALNDRLQRTLYAAHMNMAQHAWEAGGIARVRELLEQHRPKAEEADLRDFEWYFLNRLCHSDLLTLKGHTDVVDSVAYSPDGKRLASASRGEVKVWDAQTGQELLNLPGRGWGVVFSPDGKRLASGTRGDPQGEWKVRDAQTGQELLRLKGSYSRMVFSPDGKRLATAGDEVKLWDAQTGQELRTLKGPAGAAAFSPDGKRLASASGNDGTVKVWDAATGQELLSLKGYPAGVYSVAFSPDGKRLAAPYRDSMVEVWDAQTGQESLTLKHNRASSVAFSPDGKHLASSSGGGTLRIWNLKTGQEIRTFKGHSGGINNVVFSPDGKRLASSSSDKTVKVWDAQKDQENLTLQTDGGKQVAFSADLRRLASAASDNTVKIWDGETGQQVLALKGHTAPVWSIAFSPDGKRLASGGGGRRVPSGALGNSGTDRAELKLWDAQTGQELLTFPVSLGFVGSVVYSSDGRRLAAGSVNPPQSPLSTKVWDVQTGQELLSLHGGWGNVAFSPDGKRLARATGEVRVWDAQTGQELLSLKDTGRALSVVFSSDGKCLATAGDEVKLWDAQTGQELQKIKGLTNDTDAFHSVVFSPDGKRLATGAWDTIKVWDAQTGQELLTLKGGGVSVAFSLDGKRLAGSGPDGTVKIWDATPLPEKP